MQSYIQVIVEILNDKSRVNFIFSNNIADKYIKDFINSYFEVEMLLSQQFVVDDYVVIKFITNNTESLLEFKNGLELLKHKIQLLNNFSLN
jgi:hypothetical protein